MRRFLSVYAILVVCASLGVGQTQQPVCLVYFTGIGCPHCAKADPVILGELPVRYGGDIVIIEYEIYHSSENAKLINEYEEALDTVFRVPQLIIGDGLYLVGDRAILKKIDDLILERLDGGNPCPLPSSTLSFDELNLSNLPGQPKIFSGDRVLMKSGDGGGGGAGVLKKLFMSEQFSRDVAYQFNLTPTESEPVPLSGVEIRFSSAVELNGWILQWNDNTTQNPADRVVYTSTYYYVMNHIEVYTQILLALAAIILLVIIIKERQLKRQGGVND